MLRGMPRPPAPEPRKQFGLRLRVRLIRELRHVAVDQEKNLNDLVEEAVEDLLKKYANAKKKPAKKTRLEMEENIVRQLAAKRNFVMYKSRPRLYTTKGGDYQLFHISDRTAPLFPDRSPTLDELKAFLQTQPVDPTKGYYKSRRRRAERISYA